MVEALGALSALTRVLAAFRKRPRQEADEEAPSKKAKLEEPAPVHVADVADPPTSHEDDDKGHAEMLALREGVLPDCGPGQDADRGLADLTLLECPVCVDTMESPVRQCVNGHCVCNACRTRVSACPLCRGALSANKHARLDELARTLTLPCTHRPRGCLQRLRVKEREDHLLACEFNRRPCPLQPCQWTGAFATLREHCLQQHAPRAREAALGSVVCFSLELVDDGDLRSALKIEDVALFVDAEVFVVEVHVDELPGRVAVVTKHLSAGRLRPPAHVCTVAFRSKTSKTVLGAQIPAVAEDESVVTATEGGSCFVVDMTAVEKLCVASQGDPGLSLECTLARPVATPWASWIFPWRAWSAPGAGVGWWIVRVTDWMWPGQPGAY